MSELHKNILSIYKRLLPLLEEKKIHFTANGGTCIGACREKGFIKWDDDLDINIMPYDKSKLFHLLDNLPNGLIWKKEMPGIYKIFDSKKNYKGKPIFIDLMLHRYVKKINFLERFICLFLNAHFLFNWNNLSGSKYRKSLLKWPVRITTFWIPTKFSRWLFKCIISSKKKEYISQSTQINWYNNTIHPTNFFDERLKKSFEDTYIYVPKEYDEYLTRSFGDWRTPIDQSIDHYK